MALTGSVLLLFALQDPGAVFERMKSPEMSVRREAFEELRRLGGEAVPQALSTLKGAGPVPVERVKDLVGKLGAASWEERDQAARALEDLGWRALSALKSIEGQVSDVEVAWRVKAVTAEIRKGEALERELERLRAVALCRFLGEAGKAEAVGALLDRDAGGSGELAVRLSEALGRLRGVMKKDEPERAVEKILYELYPSVRDARRRALLLKAVARLKSSACVRPLTALLRDRSERDLQIKRNCVAALSATGDAEGARAILKALGAEEVYVRQAAGEQVEALAGEDFGFDPRAGADANRAAVEKFRAWCEAEYGKK